MKKDKVSVSVVIPSYNEATYINRLLKALVRQSYSAFEVIVSDARSKDGTKEVVDIFKDMLDIRFVEAEAKGPGYGRNIGAKLAQGDWLLFLDADVHIDDDKFIDRLVKKTEQRGWQTSSGQMKILGGSLLGRIGHSQGYLNLMSHTKHPIMQGYCMLTKRSVFEDNKGFNENLRYGEDNDYATRVASHGLGFVKGVYYYVDPRRYKQEGFRLLFKNIGHELHRLTHDFNFETNSSKYEFGKHPKRDKDSPN